MDVWIDELFFGVFIIVGDYFNYKPLAKRLSLLQVGRSPSIWCVAPHAGAMGVSGTGFPTQYV